MGIAGQRGFTIIELILFLGITGALFAALMIGINTNIHQQQYKDSVVSYRNLLEQQYAEVTYPRNERTDQWICDRESGVQQEPAGGQARGTSGCVLLGRYIQIENSGKGIETGNVVGIQPDGSAVPLFTNDIAALVALQPKISPIGAEDHTIEWDGTLTSVDGRPLVDSFLIVRSPLSGLIRVFASAEPLPANLATIMTESATAVTMKHCLSPGGLVGLPTQSITLNARIGNASGVALHGSDEEC